MPWVSIFVVGVVVGVGEGWLDLTAFVMQDEFGKGDFKVDLSEAKREYIPFELCRDVEHIIS